MADNKRGRGDRDENQENRNECKSAKAIKLLREVTSLLSEGDSEPYQPAAEQISQAHGTFDPCNATWTAILYLR